ncbi:MAG: cytochrome c maturation protein CcmE, partial [Gammaproteobacteria bacterium]|nr:cytochrome c maturation protein CcmE [Gammaproteobacteria bacterium]
NKRSRRKMLVAMVVFGVGIATVLALTAFDENLMYFYSPTEIHAGKAPADRAIRVGGLVVDGSVRREGNGLAVQFDLTDNAAVVPVSYTGILPDLFREGQGIVAMGRIDNAGLFVADEVLAKHDENYMPPEVADALDAAHEAGKTGAPATN